MMKNNRGQLSIFMGITMILVMGMLAFVVNVGLFVKAKINLQNSVDAAAYAGASVQARQLTNIAYLNWEMRNTYKEWMFKYYILGQLGLMGENYSLSASGMAATLGNSVNFYLHNPKAELIGSDLGGKYDMYNVPSICIHNSIGQNICPIYTLPGIPRFPAIGVAGISEIHESFVNTIVQEKAKNCSERTQLNFLTALSWAYSSGTVDVPGTPLVATNRPGAWPQALELGMRMRNLEMIVNRPPIPQPIDVNLVNSLGSQGAEFGLNERPIKAFMSGLRNLSGGRYKTTGSGASADEFSSSFKLTELPTDPFEAPSQTVSSFLIPTGFSYPDGKKATTKHYLDLQVYPVNLATMFSTFTSTSSNNYDGANGADAACIISKTAIPVPGYLLGFVKNPAVMTYYAVKGEANFTGLFFPGTSGSVKLTAYAAAKPFGGRIGPRLFGFGDGTATLRARDAANQKKTTAYISGLRALVGGYVPGAPLPTTQDFWVTSDSNLGGVPERAGVSFGVPNMIYDFETLNDLTAQTGATTLLQEINARTSGSTGATGSQDAGLYNKAQFRMLKNNLDLTSNSMSADQVMRSIIKSRGVTKYDTLNYLVPDDRDMPDKNTAVPLIRRLDTPVPGGQGINYALFAPLIGTGLLYSNVDEVKNIVGSYLSANDPAIKKYLSSMLDVANAVAATGSSGGTQLTLEAAKGIHLKASVPAGTDITTGPMVSGDPMNDKDPGCSKDMSSKFNYFFKGTITQCGIVPIEVLMTEFITNQAAADGALYYKSTYYNRYPEKQVMTAFHSGARQGVQNGMATHPLTGAPDYSAKRNFYSTKFFNLALMLSNSSTGLDKGNYQGNPLFYESADPGGFAPDVVGTSIINYIKADASTGLEKKFFHHF